MNDLESKVAKAIKRLNKMSIRYSKELQSARAALGEKCSHPAEATEHYRWEHDNGYGVQSWQYGKVCTLCLSKNPYPNSSNSWYRPEHSR